MSIDVSQSVIEKRHLRFSGVSSRVIGVTFISNPRRAEHSLDLSYDGLLTTLELEETDELSASTSIFRPGV